MCIDVECSKVFIEARFAAGRKCERSVSVSTGLVVSRGSAVVVGGYSAQALEPHAKALGWIPELGEEKEVCLECVHRVESCLSNKKT